nr:hypothetical protein [uncultured Carboxylicivirga sp.]
MSYDLLVFKKEAAPRKWRDFMTWYKKQVQSAANHRMDITNSAIELHELYKEMRSVFPDEDNAFNNNRYGKRYINNCSIGKDIIYVGFTWAVAEEAFQKMIELAEKYSVGFFDVSSEDGSVYFPEDGKLTVIDASERDYKKVRNKLRWKIWKMQ